MLIPNYIGGFMEVIVGKHSGFCGGVKNSITKAEEELRLSTNVYCLGEIIHNKQVVEDLKNKGLKIVDRIEDAKEKAIIRAHGTTKDTYEYAKTHNIELLDLTCPNVLKIHENVQKFASQNYFIFLIGIKNHAETIGTYSFCGKNSYIIEIEDDILEGIDILKSSNLKDILIISQTTFSVALFDKITNSIKEILGSQFNIVIEKSICNSTDVRQKEALELSKTVPLMIIVGGKNSSNTKKLYEVSKINLKNVIHVETKEELDLSFIKNFKSVRNYGRRLNSRLYYK